MEIIIMIILIIIMFNLVSIKQQIKEKTNYNITYELEKIEEKITNWYKGIIDWIARIEKEIKKNSLVPTYKVIVNRKERHIIRTMYWSLLDDKDKELIIKDYQKKYKWDIQIKHIHLK